MMIDFTQMTKTRNYKTFAILVNRCEGIDCASETEIDQAVKDIGFRIITYEPTLLINVHTTR